MNLSTTRVKILKTWVWLFLLTQPAIASGLFIESNLEMPENAALLNETSLSSAYAPPPPATCILLQNPGFDGNLSNWNILGDVSLSTDAYAGTHAAQVNGFYSLVSQVQTGITPGNIYTLSAYGKIEDTPWWSVIGISFYDASNTNISDTYVQINDNSYTNHQISAIAPANAVYVETYALIFGYGSFFVDEFCLEETVPVPGECIIMQNEGFEDNFTQWSTSGSMGISSDANSGSRAAELIGNGSYFYQRLGISAGQTYQLTAFSKVSINAPSYAEIFIDWRDAGNNLISSVLQPIAPTVQDYTFFTLKGKAPPGAAYALVGAYKVGSSSRRLYADDFCFSIIDDLGGNNFDLSCGCGDNLLPNGSYEENDVGSFPYSLEGVPARAIGDNDDSSVKPFETDISSDYIFYLNNASGVTNNPEGDHFFWLPDNDDAIEMDVDFTDNLLLENGETYVLCLYAASWSASLNGSGLPDGGTENQRAGILELEFKYNSGDQSVFYWSVPESDSFSDLSWTKLSYTFVYDATDPVESFSLINYLNNTGVAIDAVSLSKVNCPPVKDCDINGLYFQRWTNISSNDLEELLTDPDFPNNFDESGIITNYQGQNGVGSNYGSRAYGYIIPSITGNYTFNLTGDDDTRFFLSTDSTFLNKSRIAYIDGWTNVYEHNKYGSQTSSTIYLEAGRKYYTEVLHKEGGGQDHFQVFWRTPANGAWNIIPNGNLSPICYQETCNNGKDDDFDGLIDCFDDECSGNLGTSYSVVDENCGTGGGQIDIDASSLDTPLSFEWSDMPITAHWTFDGNTDDVSGNSNHANFISGSISYSYEAVQGRSSAYFNGSSRIRYSIDNGFMEQSFSALSVSMWIKPADLTGIKTLFDEGGSTGGRGMAIRLNNAQLSAGVRNGGNSLIEDDSHTFPNDGQWHHVAAVFDNGLFTVYLDGVPSTTYVTPYTTINNHGNNGGIGGNFGGSVLNSGSTRYRGFIDDVRYHFNVGLTPDQIADIARNDGDRFNLFAGTYTVNIISASGCAISQSITINSSSNHTAGGLIDGNESSCDIIFDPGMITNIAPANGGGAGITEYQWQSSTDNGFTWVDIPGANGDSYDPPIITVNTLYRRGGRLNPCLAWVYSDTISKIRIINFTDAGAISGEESYCSGFDPATISSDILPSGGQGGTSEFEWQMSTDTISWVTIIGENGPDIDPAPITQTTYYRRGARRSSCTGFIYSGYVTKEVVVNYTDGGIIAGAQSNCGSFDPSIISSVTTPSGGSGGSLEYQWQESIDSINWSVIAGVTTETFNPTTAIQTKYFRRGARRSPCSAFTYAEPVKVEVVVNYNSGGILSGDQSDCGSYDPFVISNVAPPAGGSDGVRIYQWQQSTDGGTTWSTIAGATGTDYDPGTLTQTTLFRRQARRTPCTTWINSNSVLKEVVPIPAATYLSYPIATGGFICEWVNYSFEATDLGFGTTYSWDFGPFAIPTSATGKGPHLVTFNIPSTADYTTTTTQLTVFRDGCPNIATMDFDIRPQIVVTSINTTDPDDCTSNNGEIEVFTSHPAGTVVEASIDGGATWDKEPLKFNNIAAGIYPLLLRYEDGECEYNWGTVTLADPGSIMTDIQLSTTEICNNEMFSVEAVSSATGNPDYYWEFGPGATPVIAYGQGPHMVSYSTGGEKTIKVTVTENFCAGLADTTITITSTYTDGGTLTGDEDLCSAGSGSTMTSDLAPSGGYGGTPEYQWESSEDDGMGGWSAWTEIAGATNESYTPAFISVNTRFRRKARRATCLGWAYSQEVEKRVSGIPVPNDDIYTSACPGFLFYDYVSSNDNNLINPVYTLVTPPVNGTLDLDTDGEFVYTPNNFFCGTDQFVYRVCNNGTTCCDTASVIIDLNDGESPVLQNIPADIFIHCDDDMPLPPIVDAWENCQNVTLGLDEASTQGEQDSCSIYSYSLYRTWTAGDYCGNNASAQQVINIQDLTAPDIYRIYTLPNGAKMVAGIMENVTQRWKTVRFPVQFNQTPVVFTQIVTRNESTPAISRLRNVSSSQFQLRIQEEENEDGNHIEESIAWIAIEPGTNTTGIPFEVSSKLLSSSSSSINFSQPYPTPGLIGNPQTFNENNPVSLRIDWINSTGANIYLQEETSLDPETNHGFETVGYMALDGSGDFINDQGEVIGEIGRISLDDDIVTVNLSHEYHNPVVVFGGVTDNGNQPVTVRVENLTSNAFDVHLHEWEYLDGFHVVEDLTYMVVEGSIPFDQEVECSAIPDHPVIGVEIVGKDNCDISTPLTITDSEFIFDCQFNATYTREYHVQDECGNTTTLVQTFILRDTTPPQFTVPADITITCLTDEHDLSITGDVTDEMDNCASDLEATYSDDLSNMSGCSGFIIRTWTLTDYCGNMFSRDQTIYIFNDNDADKDGLADQFDLDDDNDGIPDTDETDADTDNDGIPNYQDLDSDNDGIPDIIEAGLTDSNGDGIVDSYGLPDWDIDGDGLANEADGDQSDPSAIASDTFDPLSAVSDVDGDGIPNYQDLDSDNDGIPDIIEAGGVDVDGDGAMEYPIPGVAESFLDADGDGFFDGYDPDDDSAFGIDQSGDVLITFSNGIYSGGSGNYNPDFDGDGIPDFYDLDSDNDGITDLLEAGGVDTNGDGIIDDGQFTDLNNNGFYDTYESNALITTEADGAIQDGRPEDINGDGTVYNNADADRDNAPNQRDSDSDNDNINDIIEVGYALLDTNNDGQIDIFSDGNNDGLNDGSFGLIFTDGDGITSDGRPEDDADTDNSSYNSTMNDGEFGQSNGEPDLDDDGDSIPNFLDTDSDNDFLPDAIEDQNGNGITDSGETGWLDSDSDDDLILDGIEDANQDGIYDPITETNPLDADSDDDSLDDGFEDNNQNGIVDGIGESDPRDPCDPLVNPSCIGVMLDVRVKLAGALIENGFDTLMRDDLRNLDVLPLQEPYTALPYFSHVGEGGGETTTQDVLSVTGEDAVVDWVFLELRATINPSIVVSTRSALLKRNGKVTDVDGVSPVRFQNIPSGAYHIAVKHRNHLGSGIINPRILSPDPTFIDLANESNEVFGGETGQALIHGTEKALWLGDANGNRKVIYQGPANDVYDIFFHVMLDQSNNLNLANFISIGYYSYDINMDGFTIYQGPGNDKSKILFYTVLTIEDNFNNLANFVVTEKLP